MDELKNYWTQRYIENKTGWELGVPSTPLVTYFDQLDDKEIKILIPGAGNSQEAAYLYDAGFLNVDVLDISKYPLTKFADRNPDFPASQLIEGDFFTFEGQYDLIIEQTFFCSFPPEPSTRNLYAQRMYELLKPDGKLVGVWFDIPLTGDMVKRPFGGSKKEYLSYLSPFFETRTFETCYNSVPSRAKMELFGIFKRRS